jgi:hypothetical protein
MRRLAIVRAVLADDAKARIVSGDAELLSQSDYPGASEPPPRPTIVMRFGAGLNSRNAIILRVYAVISASGSSRLMTLCTLL